MPISLINPLPQINNPSSLKPKTTTNKNQQTNKTSQLNIAQPVILNKKIPFSPIQEQEKLVKEIDELKKQLAAAKEVMDEAATKR